MDFSIRPIEGPEVLFYFLTIFFVWTLFCSCCCTSSGCERDEKHSIQPACVYKHHIALVSNEKTRNLLQKISKCDKEIQLIRIRCRHMRLQLRFFLSPAILPTSAGSGMKQKTIKTKSHAVQLEEIRLDWSSEKRAN